MLGIVQVREVSLERYDHLFLVFVFFTAASNQATASFYDFKSDAQYGYQTLPVIFGTRTAARIATGLRLLGWVFLLAFLCLKNWTHPISVIALLGVGALPLLVYRFLNRADEQRMAFKAFKIAVTYTLLSFVIILLGIYR